MRVLFVTTEMDDFVRVGGLAAVSAALPRALRPMGRCQDPAARISRRRRTIHAYSNRWPMRAAGGNAGLHARPLVDAGRSAGLRPALPAALRPARQPLWRRVRPRLARQRHPLRPAGLGCGRTRRRHSGQELGSRSGPRQRLAGRARAGLPHLERGQSPLHPDHPQPGLSGSVPQGIAAPHRRAGELVPHRRRRVLRQAVLPQGRNCLRVASDHRQRDLCQGDHHARARLRAGRPASPVRSDAERN